MQVPQWADPIPMGQRGGPGPRAMSGGWGQDPDYFLGPRIPVLNWQVIVKLHVLYMFLEPIVHLHRVIVHYYIKQLK